MNIRALGVLAYLVILLLPATGAAGGKSGILHHPPFDFVFDNHLDTHQQTRLDRRGELKGALYIIYTGEQDTESGLPIARHPRGAAHGETCGVDPIDCVVGWKIKAVRSHARFLYHSGVSGDDHPVWMLAGRNALPQPGSYTHFHWVSALSTDERAVAGEIPMPCDVANASELEGDVVGGDLTLGSTTWEGAEVHVGGGAENLVCPGWLLELKAVRSFAFEHGGGVMPVRPGVDNRTHLNVVINYALAPDVSGSGSGH